MRKMIALVFISCFLLPQFAFAGAWTLPKNKIWTEFVMKTNWAKKDFGPDQEAHRKNRDARSWGWSLNPKAEYGVTDWFTVLGSMEYKEAQYKEFARPNSWGPYSVKNHGLTNVDFGGKIRLLKEPAIVSAQVKASYYTKYAESPMSDVTEAPELTKRNDSVEGRVLIGKKWSTKVPFYLGAEAGYRYRNRGLSNDIPVFVEGGFWPARWLLVKTEIDGYLPHDGTGDSEDGYLIWRIGPVFQILHGDSVTREGKSFDIGLSYGLVFWGKNTSADQEAVAKVSFQF